jgi:hypothetical protein
MKVIFCGCLPLSPSELQGIYDGFGAPCFISVLAHNGEWLRIFPVRQQTHVIIQFLATISTQPRVRVEVCIIFPCR